MAGSGIGAEPVAGGFVPGGFRAGALLAVEQAAIDVEAGRVRAAGEHSAGQAVTLVAALDAAAAAAGAAQLGATGGLLSGPALAECAALLARRAQDTTVEAAGLSGDMVRAAGLLVDADGEVAHGVTRAAG